MTLRRDHGAKSSFRVAVRRWGDQSRIGSISLLGGKLSGHGAGVREILEFSLGRGGIFWYQLLTDEVLVLKVLPSGLRAGSLLRAANDNTISSYANVLTKTVNDLGLGPNRILTKLN